MYKGNRKSFGIILPEVNSGLYMNHSPKAPKRKAPLWKACPSKMKITNSKISIREKENEKWNGFVRADKNSMETNKFGKHFKVKDNIKINSPANYYFFEQRMMAIRYEGDKFFKERKFHEASLLYKEGFAKTKDFQSCDKEETESTR